MFSKDYIQSDIPSLSPNCTLVQALDVMEIHKLRHVAVVDGAQFWGLISETDIFEQDSFDNALVLYPHLLRQTFIYGHNHIYDAAKLFHLEKTDIVPVLNDQNHFLGCISQENMLNALINLTSAAEEGEILLLKMSVSDLYISQIAHLAEENDTKIISLNLTPKKHSTQIYLTLKVNTNNASRFINALERYNYNVEVFSKQLMVQDENISNNYQLLMKYLNI